MPSPFPGMNPYLERPRVWHDFHQAFAVHCRQALSPQVRPKFIVTLEDNIYVHESSDEHSIFVGRSDVSIVDSGVGNGGGAATATTAAPVTGRIKSVVEDLRESYIEILDRDSRELITVIEIISPTNKKPGKDREQFEYKRALLAHGGAHYVEIDLLRGGPRLPIENLPECDAYAMVSRYEDRPQVDLWPVSLRDPLPTIPIPLRPPVADAQLDLQALLHQTYDASGYADYIYAGQPDPPLGEKDSAWAQELVERSVGG